MPFPLDSVQAAMDLRSWSGPSRWKEELPVTVEPPYGSRRWGWAPMAPRFIAKQLSWPTGIGGWLVRAGMNRGNARLNSYALDQLQLVPEDRAIEVGFGGGAALPRLLRGAAFACGVDRSQDVVDVAARRLANAVRAGRAEFRVGTVENLPLPDATFDKALSVHTVYFWQSLGAGSAELTRVLKSGGRVMLGFLPKAHMDRMNMPADIFTPREPDEVIAVLQDARFSDIEMRRPGPETAWLVATGVPR
ncbi:class I SAM-dependent methyltransferase [Mesorhizobium sp. B4-1-1]|nr:class I SAM-dependent methyltransferase [Mesorhizobium sp. B4-1-1]